MFLERQDYLNNRLKTIAIKWCLIVLVCLLNFDSYSQNNSYYLGFLYRYEDNSPIENAHVNVYVGTNVEVFVSDKEGKFKIPINLLKDDFSIHVTVIGFEKLTISNILQHTFKLKEKVDDLDEVFLESSDIEKALKDDLSWSKTLITFEKATNWNSLLAVYVPYQERNANKKIKLLKYGVTDLKWTKGLKYLPFEAAIFSVNKETKLPEIPIISNPPIKLSKGQKWVSVDISEFGILVPNEGLFLVMKILSKEYYNEQYIATAQGAIEAAPAIRFYKFDPNYIRKSYQYFPFSEDQSDDSPFKEWQLFKGHFLIDYEY